MEHYKPLLFPQNKNNINISQNLSSQLPLVSSNYLFPSYQRYKFLIYSLMRFKVTVIIDRETDESQLQVPDLPCMKEYIYKCRFINLVIPLFKNT